MEVIRCRNNKSKDGEKPPHFPKNAGGILCVYEGDRIYIKCGERRCKRWTEIKVSIPGINIDFSNAGFTQTVMPDGFKIKHEIGKNDIKRAAVIIRES